QVQYPNHNNKNQRYPNNRQGQPNNANQAAQNEANTNQTFSPQNLSRNEIRQIQQALDKNGQQVGRVDGRWGPKTSDALKQFQQSKGIQTNGQLDQQTLSSVSTARSSPSITRITLRRLSNVGRTSLSSLPGPIRPWNFFATNAPAFAELSGRDFGLRFGA